MNPNKLNILALNIGRKMSELTSLGAQAAERLPVIICIQDLFNKNTKPKQEAIPLIFPEYVEHHTGEEGCRISTLTKNGITIITKSEHKQGNNLTILLLTLTLGNSHTETIVNMYARPTTTSDELHDGLTWIGDRTRNMSRTTIIGDLNASNPTWDKDCIQRQLMPNTTQYDSRKLQKGATIERWASKWNLICLNEARRPTTFRGNDGHASSIDIAFCGPKATRKWRTLDTIPNEDHGHSTIIISSVCNTSTEPREQKGRYIYRTDLIKDRMIEAINLSTGALCQQTIVSNSRSTVTRMNTIVDSLYENIISIQNQIKKPVRTRGIKLLKRTAQLKSCKMQHLIQRLKRLEKLRTERAPRTATKHLRKKQNKVQKMIINTLLQEEHSEQTSKDLWQRLRIFTPPGAEGNLQISSKDDIEQLAKTKFPVIYRNLKRTQLDHNVHGTAISTQESQNALGKLRNKRYNSPEGINMKVFYTVTKRIPEIMHLIAQMSFTTRTIPTKAEYTVGTIIPKKKEGQYRIVHVSSPIAAYLEGITLARLQYRLEENNLIHKNQFGFTALRSRHDLMAKIIESVFKHKRTNNARDGVHIISMDIEGAFDNVDQTTLTEKLQQKINDAPLSDWITSFLDRRKISVKYKNLRSQYRIVYKGVPQGSALGPILWNFAINEIGTKINTHDLLQYADDIYLVFRGSNTKNLQTEINNFIADIRNLKLNVRPEKCSRIRINHTPSPLDNGNNISIDGTIIPESKEMNILGMMIDQKLHINKNNNELRDRLTQTAEVLNKLKRAKLIRNPKEWRQLVDSLIISRTVANYWPLLAVNNRDRLWIEEITNKTIKTALGWPKITSNKLVKLLSDRREIMSYTDKMINSRMDLEFRQTYEYIKTINERNYAETGRENITTHQQQIRRRRYANPEKLLTTRPNGDRLNRDEAWFVMEGSKFSGLIQIRDCEVKSELLGLAWHWPNTYTNTLAILTHATKQDTTKHKTILINNHCSILQALRNQENHDEAIIKLREQMISANWSIRTVEGELFQSLNKYVKRHYKNSSVQTELGDTSNIFEQWIQANEARPSNPNPQHRATALKEPDLSHLRRRFENNKKFWQESRAERIHNLTSTCREFETNAEKWLNMNPAKLGTRDAMMLTGLVRNDEGNIIKDIITTRTNYNGEEQRKKLIWHRLEELDHNDTTRTDETLIKKIKRIARTCFGPMGSTNRTNNETNITI